MDASLAAAAAAAAANQANYLARSTLFFFGSPCLF
jgi:hypothetical protein